MKVSYSITSSGECTIYDKRAEKRVRGTQFDLPKPQIGKKATVYILAEDQVPKKRFEVDLEKNLDKILDNYEHFKDFKKKDNKQQIYNSSKNFVWGYPKKNPNQSKKYYSKKSKK